MTQFQFNEVDFSSTIVKKYFHAISTKMKPRLHPKAAEIEKLKCYTVMEVADLLGVSKATLYKLMKSGEIKFITLSEGGDRRIPATEVRAYIERRSQ